MNILSSSTYSTWWPKQREPSLLIQDEIINTFVQEPILDIRNNAWVLQNRKLTYNHTEKIWTHNGYDRQADYARQMDIYRDEYGNKRYCLQQDPESQYFIYLVCQDFVPLSPIIQQKVPVVRRSRQDTLRQTFFHDARYETRYFSLHVPFDNRPENKNEYDYAFDCALMSDLVNMASDMEYGTWSNNRRFLTKKQDWNQKNVVSKHLFYDFGACWIYDLPESKKYPDSFLYYLASARSGYTLSYEKERVLLFIDKLRDLYTIIASEKKLHQIQDAVLQSNYVTYIDLYSRKKPAERSTFSCDEKMKYIAQNTQLTLLSRIIAMIRVTEELAQTL